MRNYLFFFLTIGIFSSAKAQTDHNLTGAYPPNATGTLMTDYEHSWMKLMTWLENVDYPTQMVERSSGIVVSAPVALSWCFENKDGSLPKPMATVWPTKWKTKDAGTNWYIVTPAKVVGQLEIHLHDNGSGSTVITVNITHIEMIEGNYDKWPAPVLNMKSTGILEQEIINELLK